MKKALNGLKPMMVILNVAHQLIICLIVMEIAITYHTTPTSGVMVGVTWGKIPPI